jgi:biopolymer transport protein ExbD/biopolymer transport protein TolR
MSFAPHDPQRGFRPQAEINVTPLVDVMLVLLIIFMVTAPLLAAGMKVDLPQSRAAQPMNPKEPIVVIIGKDGGVALGGETVARADLAARVKLQIGDDASRVVHLKGDRQAAFGDVVAVMDDLASQGVAHLAILTNKTRATPEARAAK